MLVKVCLLLAVYLSHSWSPWTFFFLSSSIFSTLISSYFESSNLRSNEPQSLRWSSCICRSYRLLPDLFLSFSFFPPLVSQASRLTFISSLLNFLFVKSSLSANEECFSLVRRLKIAPLHYFRRNLEGHQLTTLISVPSLPWKLPT